MSKADVKTDTGAVEEKQKNYSNPKRSTHSNNGHTDEQPHKRKPNSTQHQSRQSNRDNSTRGSTGSGNRSGAGGRDSSRSHKQDKYRSRDPADHGGSRHSNRRDNRDGGGWSKPQHKSSSGGGDGSRKGYSKTTHSNKTSKVPLEGRDSGISVGEGCSPEGTGGGGGGGQKSDKDSGVTHVNDPAGITKGDSPESPLANIGSTTDRSGSDDTRKNADSPEALDCEDDGNGHIERTLPEHVYDREALLEFRECTMSLLTPTGFEQLSLEISKDILKATHRHSSTGGGGGEGEENDSDGLADDSVTPRHGSISSLTREHHGDQKSNTKVSLMPQRRSFGSGCSWRDSKPLTTPGNNDYSPQLHHHPKPDEKSNDSSSGGVWSGQHGTHPSNHKVIDHVPYRSRQGGGDWKTGRAPNWKDKSVSEYEEEEEPEWMSFAPTDRYELMELKGIEEHELEREARKEAETRSRDEEERKSSNDGSPSSSTSPLDKDPPKSDIVDSGLPSSCPNDEDDGFILDGFDFKSVLSMCQELASDSDDDGDPVHKDSLYKAKDTNELKNALISVLGISKEETMAMRTRGGGVPLSPVALTTPSQPGGRALTLDEIEGQSSSVLTSQGDDDQSAFNKFLATLNTTNTATTAVPSPQEMGQQYQGQNLQQQESGSGFPFKSLPKAGNRSLFIEKLDEDPSLSSFHSHDHSSMMYSSHPSQRPSSLYSPSSTLRSSSHTNESLIPTTVQQQSPQHQSGWPSAWDRPGEPHPSKPPSHLLNPSPSSLGMHPHQLRPQKHVLGGGGGGGATAAAPQSNSSWVMEMEQMRITELNQMRYHHGHHHQQQQQQYERQMRTMHRQQQLSQQKQTSGGPAPSLSFLPTSVMRHMHNSKPNQPIKDIARTTMATHPPNRRMDTEFSSQSAEYPLDNSIYPPTHHHHHHQQQQGPPPPVSPHYHYPPSSSFPSYRPNIRGGTVIDNTGQGYQPSLSSRPQVPQYMRMGTSSMNPNLY